MNQGFSKLVESEGFWKLVIVLDTIVWGLSFVLMKDVVREVPVFWLLFWRYLISALVAAALFVRRIAGGISRQTLVFGLVMGVTGWLAYVFQTAGIAYTTAGKNAFLTAVYCVLVPFVAWRLGMGKPAANNVLGAVVSLVGMGFVAVDNGLPINRGDALTLVCAVVFAVQLALIPKVGRGADIMVGTVIQFAVEAALSLPCALAFEEAPAAATFTPTIVGELLFLAVFATVIVFLLYNKAFTEVDPTAGAVLSALESPWGVFFSVLLTGEVLTPQLLLGFGLIFCGILVSEVGPKLVARLHR